MQENTKKIGKARLGIKVLNLVSLADSSPKKVMAVGDLKVGRFVFKGVTFSREEGKEAVVKLPWETQLVSIPAAEDLEKVNHEVYIQVNLALDGLKAATGTGLWS